MDVNRVLVVRPDWNGAQVVLRR
ncbi:hypothetical protein SSE37_21925 [Sagittula stellata E-37]|uniref:Uncharacterized protein n=1 Tax=Sagittula stellata (strain ATCC 700073 / DSM 11524 / E-37) TaxID=388399 RepID=A3K5W3_SAGS3|nr:hypothetical protein SSE37_21925 [Sagittula stellata E-37]